MSMRADDDDELSFAEDVRTDASTESRDDVAEPAAAPVPEPSPEAPAAEAPAAPPKPEAKAADEGEQAAAPAAHKRSRTGMAVAAGFAICIIASVTSAVQVWRVASMVAHGSAGKSDTALEAKLNNIEKLLEQQRNALDGLATPAAVVAPAGDGDQINALAAAVRANQEMTERLPAMIMQNVDAKLAGARHVAKTESHATRPVSTKKAVAKKPAAVAKVEKKSVTATATATAALPLKAVQPISAEPPKRPAGEAIRYP